MGKEQYKGKDIRGERQPLKWHALRRFAIPPKTSGFLFSRYIGRSLEQGMG